MKCPVCGGEKFTQTALPGVDFCDDCEDRDAAARAAREWRSDARNVDDEIRQALDELCGKLFNTPGGAEWKDFEDMVIVALNAERRIILRAMLEAESRDGLIHAVAGRLGKER